MDRETGETRHPVTAIVLRIEETHRRIRNDLSILEKSDDVGEIGAAVDELPILLKEHFRDEERPDGLFDEVEALRPTVAPEIKVLRQEHLEIIRTLEGLQQLLRGADAASPGSELQQLQDEIRVSKAVLLQQIHQHERVESALVADTYYGEDGVSG